MGHGRIEGETDLFGSKLAVPALVIAVLVFVAAPVTLAVKNSPNAQADELDDDNGVVNVTGTVTDFLYDDHEADDTDDEDADHGNDTRVCAFVIDNSTVVEFGPWWYWMYNGTNITDFVHVGDTVNVTGEYEDDSETSVLCAWHIDNLTSGEELTIKEEGRPPWAGGPKGLGIDPWPPSDEDD